MAAVKQSDGDGKITDEALARIRSKIGVERAAMPWASVLSEDICRHYAMYSIATDNPRYVGSSDGEQAAQIAPIATAEYVACSLDKRLGGPGLPGIFALHAQDAWTFFRRAELNERVQATVRLASIEERESRWGGRAVWQDMDIDFHSASGELISRYTPTTVRAERQKARESQKYEAREPYVYSDDEVERILADYAEEGKRVAPTSFGSIAIGDSVGQVVKGPLTVMDLMCWWIGAGGPYVHAFKQRYLQQQRHPTLAIRDAVTNVPRSPEDAHFDSEYAKRSGVGNMYDIGRQRTASVVHLVTNWASPSMMISRIETKFRAPVFVGDCSWYRGHVSSLDESSQAVGVSVEGVNQRGEVHTTGTVTLFMT